MDPTNPSDDGQKPAKVAKITKGELYKPPSNEEMRRLREADILFHSNMIGLQIEETLREIAVDSQRKQAVNQLLMKLRETVIGIPKKKNRDLEDLSVIDGSNVKIPFNLNSMPKKVNGNFAFSPPGINVVGSYRLDTCIRRPIKIDFLLIMPKECMQEKDFMNQRYLRKRALYLSYVADELKKSGEYDVEFGYFNEEPMKPVLYVKPKGKLRKALEIIMHVCPEEFKSFHVKTKRFIPTTNNVRKEWFFGHNKQNNDTEAVATPYYNSLILSDLLMEFHYDYLKNVCETNDGMKDAIKLLKVWLRQRDLDQGFSPFNGFLVSMVLAYLYEIKKVREGMSSFQIIRVFFKFLVESDWSVKGIGFQAEDSDDESLTVEDFQRHFPIVFVGPSGNLNLCYAMSLEVYNQVRDEAGRSLEAFEKKKLGFDAVFMTKVSFARKFDQIIHFPNPQSFRKVCKKLNLDSRLLDHCGNHIPVGLSALFAVLKRALQKRVKSFGVKHQKYPRWKTDESPPNWSQVAEFVSIGIIYDEDNYNSVIDKGPQANLPEAEEFREFWGEVSEKRRFKDASILEAVYWSCKNALEKREIITKICLHILKRKCDLPRSAMRFPTSLLDEFLMLKYRSLPDGCKVGYDGTGDEENVDIVNTYNELCQLIRNLDLPLSITNMQGIAPALRYSEVYVPSIVKFPDGLQLVDVDGVQVQVPVPTKPCPTYVHPIEIICNMEGSGKWPEDVDAIQRIKAAFHISIAEELKKNKSLICIPRVDCLEIYQNGIVFRVIVAYHRESSLMQVHKTPEGMVKMRSTPESNALEYKTQHIPLLASQLHGLHQRCESFGRSCRLVKKWLSAHMFSNHINDEAADLLMAYIYTQSHPYPTPGNSTVAFMRLLTLLSTFNFAEEPIIVDFNSEMTDADVDNIHRNFKKNRNALPTMCIFTSSERQRSLVTFDKPSKVVIQRIRNLAKEASKTLDSAMMSQDSRQVEDLKVVFAPYNSCKVYEAIIKLRPEWISRRFEATANEVSSELCNKSSLNKESQPKVFPVVGFDPVASYVQRLEENFGDFAMFFYNKHGQTEVGVLWLPGSRDKKPFKVGDAACMGARDDDGKVALNIAAVIHDFEVLGRGLVESVIVR